jgi:formate transporter
MDNAKPADVVASMVDAGSKKLALGPRDLLIRGAMSGALLGAATTLAFTGAVTTGQPLVGALIFPVSLVLCVTCKPAKQTTSAAPPVVAQAAAE